MSEGVLRDSTRRVLTPDLVQGLEREWKLHTRDGKNKRALRDIGPLHVYLGWTEHELQEYRMSQACPVEEPAPAPRRPRWLRAVAG